MKHNSTISDGLLLAVDHISSKRIYFNDLLTGPATALATKNCILQSLFSYFNSVAESRVLIIQSWQSGASFGVAQTLILNERVIYIQQILVV